jgi:hypothetical protein
MQRHGNALIAIPTMPLDAVVGGCNVHMTNAPANATINTMPKSGIILLVTTGDMR